MRGHLSALMCWMLLVTLIPISPATATEENTKLAPLVNGNTEFAMDLYSALRTKPGNIFFSPYSISSALAMTYGGAQGNTAKEMQQTMHYLPVDQETHEAFAALRAGLEEIGKKANVQLYIANSLWPQKDYPFLSDYLTLLKDKYNTDVTPVDYSKDAENARKTINQWVVYKTRDKIDNLIGPGVLRRLTRLVLVNAIYFQGHWATQFQAEKTKERAFHLSATETVKVPMMTQEKRFAYADLENHWMIELPYVGNDMSMLILLPKEIDGLAQLESALSKDTLAAWQDKLKKRNVLVYLPKFTMTWGAHDIRDALKSLGMTEAFNDTRADFSGMDGRRHWLYISAILHKAFVDVNEEGTEAAASTAVVMTIRSMPDPLPVFRADHPFLFLIQDYATRSILFMGRVANPAANTTGN